MAGFRAVKASTSDEVYDAVHGNCPVIAIDNKNLFKKVKEMSDHDVAAEKSVKKAMGRSVASAGAFAGFIALCALGPASLFTVGTVGFISSGVVGLFSATYGVEKKIWSSLSNEMRDYKWFELDAKGGKILILYRYRGHNKFDPKTDTVDLNLNN